MIKNKIKLKSIIFNKTLIASFFIIIVSVIVSIPMLNPNFNMQFDDGIQHICRLIGTEQSIKENQLFPVIMSKLCNNFGYSWNLFYSPITSYIPLIFRIFTNSYELCLKLFMMIVSIATGFAMYFFVKKFLKGKEISNDGDKLDIIAKTSDSKKIILNSKKIEMIAILASVLYILLPYRLNDMYLRIAVAELTSFIFLPIVFNGLYSIVNLKEKSWLLVVGGAGMLLTHSLLTVYLVIFCVIYLIINIKKLDKKIILRLLASTGIILLLTAFYWIPLLQAKLSANYEVFNEGHMVRWDAMVALKATLPEIAFYKQERMFYGVGILVIIGTALSFTILKRKDIDRKNFIFFLICGIVSTIMALDSFPFEKLPSIFTMMQFSFRMLEFGGFFLCICAPIAIGLSVQKFNVYTVLAFTCVSIVLLLPNLKELHYGEYYSEEDLINGIEVTSNTGRVHAGCASFEYLPSKAFENRKYIEEREDVPIILNINDYMAEQDNSDSSESTNIKVPKIFNYSKNGTNLYFYVGYNYTEEDINDEKILGESIKTKENEVESETNSELEDNELLIELPYIYYIGYNVEYTDRNGNSYKACTYESDNGFLCISVPDAELAVSVKYTGTVLMKIAYITSAVTALVLIIMYITARIKYKKIVKRET